MDFNTHIKTLNKFAKEFDIQMKNFNFHTDIYNLNNKSFELNNNKNNMEIKTYNIDYDKISNSNNFSDLFMFIEDKKLKRKHLLKKIHPDKINFLITKIKLNHNIHNIDFDFEIVVISKCVRKIISENLNIMDGLKLLYIQTKLFDFICEDIGFNLFQINKLKNYFNSTNQTQFNSKQNTSELNDIDECFISLFPDDIINFVNTFNIFASIKSFRNQIKIIFNSIYTQIQIYVEKIINSIEKIYIGYKKINSEKKSLFDSYLIYDKYDDIYNKLREIRKNEYNMLTEQLNMYKEEFRIQLHIYNLTVTNNDNMETLKSLLKHYKFIGKNKNFYEYLDELEKKLPIFYEGIMNIKLVKYLSFICLPYSYELDFSQIAKEEIDKVKYGI